MIEQNIREAISEETTPEAFKLMKKDPLMFGVICRLMELEKADRGNWIDSQVAIAIAVISLAVTCLGIWLR